MRKSLCAVGLIAAVGIAFAPAVASAAPAAGDLIAAAQNATPSDPVNVQPVAATTPAIQPVGPVAMPPGDTIELRTGVGAAIGAVIGGLAGLPFFVVGAIPGAVIGGLIGAGIGALSWNIANTYLGGQ